MLRLIASRLMVMIVQCLGVYFFQTQCMSNAAYTLVDNTGCRAPFWRQLKGDIAYIDVVLHDSPDLICITASTHGYFVNGVCISSFCSIIIPSKLHHFGDH